MAKGSGDIRDPKLRNLMAARCCLCGEYFASDAAFMRHHLPSRDAAMRRQIRCLSRAEMDRLGMIKGGRGLRTYGRSLASLGYESITQALDTA